MSIKMRDIRFYFKSDVHMFGRHRLTTDVNTFLSFTTPTKISVEILFYIGFGPMSDDIILVVKRVVINTPPMSMNNKLKSEKIRVNLIIWQASRENQI